MPLVEAMKRIATQSAPLGTSAGLRLNG